MAINLKYGVSAVGVLVVAGAGIGIGLAATGTSGATLGTAQSDGCVSSSIPNFTLTSCKSAKTAMQAQANSLWPKSGTTLSSAEAASDASKALSDQLAASGEKVPSSGAVYETQTTYGGAGAYMEATNPFVSPSTPVWVVTTHWTQPIVNARMGLHPSGPSSWSTTTVILDAVSGRPIDQCEGCTVVQPDGSLQSATRTS